MSLRSFSWLTSSTSGRRNKKTATGAARDTRRRVLRLEQLEGRQLLSVGLGLGVAPSPTPAVPYAVAAVPRGVDVVSSSPVITSVAASPTQGVLTWIVAAAAGVTSSTLVVDGVAVSNVLGGYTAAPGLAYAWSYKGLSSGDHTYVITATDALGNTSQTSAATFSVIGPTIGMVVTSAEQGLLTWNAAAPHGVALSSLTVDGVAVTNIYGAYEAPPGLAFAWVYKGLSSGEHTYVITATDNAGNWTQSSGAFTAIGPTISRVVTVAEQNLLTWNAAAPHGVALVSLTVDGAAVTNLYGAYEAPPGLAYAWSYAGLSAGTHTYVIAATDNAGNWTQSIATFTVIGPTISRVAMSASQSVLTWNVAAYGGVASSTVTVDGVAATTVYGAYIAPPGVAYAWVYGALPSGNHNYVVTATDAAGNWSQYTGSVFVGPTINGVVVSAMQAAITWNVAAGAGVASSSLLIDGGAAANIYGPYATTFGVAYSGSYGALTSGTHAYVITATDFGGNKSQYSGSFVVGPMISRVVASASQLALSWNVAAAGGVASSGLMIDGAVATNVLGPTAVAPGLAYSWLYGGLASGSHTYVITAADNGGRSSQLTGTFDVS